MLRTILSVALFPLFLILITTSIAYSGDYELTTDKEAFLAEYPNLMKQDFSAANISPGNTKACPSPMDTNSDNICVSPGTIRPGLRIRSGDNFQSLRIFGVNFEDFGNAYNSLVANGVNPYFVEFPLENYGVVGLNIGCTSRITPGCNQELEVAIFGPDDVAIGSTIVVGTTAFDTFLGISSSEPISFIAITSVLPEVALPGISAVYVGRGQANIPTLSEWGLIAMAGAIGIIGLFYIRKKRAAA